MRAMLLHRRRLRPQRRASLPGWAEGDRVPCVSRTAGDPDGQVYEAWAVKEGLRDLYTLWGAPHLARHWLDALITDCRAGTGPEVRGMARTLVQWRTAILAWHTTGYTNGPVEGLNSLIKKPKTRRRRLPELHQLPATHPARGRRLQLGPTRHPTPLNREAPEYLATQEAPPRAVSS